MARIRMSAACTEWERELLRTRGNSDWMAIHSGVQVELECFICVHMHLCTHIWRCMYIYVQVHVCAGTCIFRHMYAQIHVWACVGTCVCKCMCMQWMWSSKNQPNFAVAPQASSTFRGRFSPDLTHSKQAKMDGQQALEIQLSLLLQYWACKCLPSWLAFLIYWAKMANSIPQAFTLTTSLLDPLCSLVGL